MTAPSLDEICKRYGLLKPSRRERLVHRAPRFGEYYWVDFHHDAYAPEFFGEHPGIVVRAAQSLGEPCIIVPVTSKQQDLTKHVHRLSKNPNPSRPDLDVWAVCDHLYTINLARLRVVWNRQRQPVLVPKNDMDAISAAIRAAMHRVFSATTTILTETTSTTVAVIEPGEAPKPPGDRSVPGEPGLSDG